MTTQATASLLLVDDDPVSLALLAGYLEPEGYRLTFASDGEEAWRLLCDSQQGFDLLVSDRSMPRMDGMELLRRIKADSRFADLPVIFETGLVQQTDIAEGISAGVHYYLTKPFNFRLLLAVVKAALDDRAQRKALAEATQSAAGAISLLRQGSFQLSLPQQARELSSLLASGVDRADAVAMGLSELMLNGIEHGNLEIGYEEKNLLLIEGGLQQEILRRIDAAPWRGRFVSVEVERDAKCIRFQIADQGAGFDPGRYLELDPGRALDPNGRGIALARRIAFTRVEYLGKGNIVAATVEL